MATNEAAPAADNEAAPAADNEAAPAAEDGPAQHPLANLPGHGQADEQTSGSPLDDLGQTAGERNDPPPAGQPPARALDAASPRGAADADLGAADADLAAETPLGGDFESRQASLGILTTHKACLVLEAALLCASDPMPLSRMVDVLFDGQISSDTVRALLDELQRAWQDRGFELVCLDKGWRVQAKPEMADRLLVLSPERAPRYSRAVMEVLTIIAHRQPVTRADITEIRGTSASLPLFQPLIQRGWIETIGFRDAGDGRGRAALYATTAKFLDDMKLASIGELVSLSELPEEGGDAASALPQEGDSLPLGEGAAAGLQMDAFEGLIDGPEEGPDAAQASLGPMDPASDPSDLLHGHLGDQAELGDLPDPVDPVDPVEPDGMSSGEPDGPDPAIDAAREPPRTSDSSGSSGAPPGSSELTSWAEPETDAADEGWVAQVDQVDQLGQAGQDGQPEGGKKSQDSARKE